ncbi:MAG: DoxX family protein [Verrucomicrobia bacterium]|nr:DoxX family protein [Verrucomicrobiota bacterium]
MNTTTAPTLAQPAAGESGFRSLVSAVLRTDTAAAGLILRLTLAVVMFPHGAQKLLGWFGGYGFAGTMGFFTGTMGIPWLLAAAVIVGEFFAPLFLVLGLATRPAALLLGTIMTVALFQVQVQHGFFMNWFGNQKGEGIEFTLLFLGIALTLLFTGGGKWSLDRQFAPRA